MKPRVLYLHHRFDLEGSGTSLRQMVLGLRDAYAITVAGPARGPLLDALEADGVRVEVVDGLRGVSALLAIGRPAPAWRRAQAWFRVPRGVRAAEGLCRRLQPDIVHINSSALFHLAAGARRAGVRRVVLHVREPCGAAPGSVADRYRLRVVGRCVDQVLAITREDARRFGFEDRTVLVRNWADFAGRDGSVDERAARWLADCGPYFLVPGGRPPHKGTLLALEALVLMRNRGAAMLVLGGQPSRGVVRGAGRRLLRLAGGATYGMRLDRLAAELAPGVLLLGRTGQVKALFERALAVVCPFAWSHFARPVLEAAAVGRPAVCADGPHAREAVVPDRTGWLTPCGDARALAGVLDRLAAHPAEADAAGAEAQAWVRRRFDADAGLSALRRVYGTATGDRQEAFGRPA